MKINRRGKKNVNEIVAKIVINDSHFEFNLILFKINGRTYLDEKLYINGNIVFK